VGAAPAARQARAGTVDTLSAAGAPGDPVPVFTPAACTTVPEGTAADGVRCGTVTVPLRYDRPTAGTIHVPVYVIRATTAPRREDALVITGGGPGDDLIALAPVIAGPQSPLGRLSPDRDIVVYNQRGTAGGSPVLNCPEIARAYARTDLTTAQQYAAIDAADRTCAAALRAAKIDTAAYNTVANAKDLEQVRRALGYAQLNLWGTSYGTRLALEAMRRLGRHTLRTVILSSPTPTQITLAEQAAPAFQSRLDELYRSCNAQPACTERHGDLRAAAARAVARLAAKPQRRTVQVDGRDVSVWIDAPRLSGAVFSLMYSPAGIKLVAPLLSEAASGTYTTLTAVLAAGQKVDRGGNAQAYGMQRVVWCNDFVSHTTARRVAAAGANVSPLAGRYFQLDAVNSGLFGPRAFHVCRRYGTRAHEVQSTQPVSSDIPTLVQTGQFDPITPPEMGHLVNTTLTRGYVFTVPGFGHSALLQLPDGCTPRIVNAFLDRPLHRPDTSCAENLPVAPAPATTAEKNRLLAELSSSGS
jgi:pimeloyl-ACP methyl ester carboxylesterase